MILKKEITIGQVIAVGIWIIGIAVAWGEVNTRVSVNTEMDRQQQVQLDSIMASSRQVRQLSAELNGLKEELKGTRSELATLNSRIIDIYRDWLKSNPAISDKGKNR